MRNTRAVACSLATPTSGCIYSKGKNWCAPMLGARKWPVGQPELAEVVLSEHDELPAIDARIE